MSASTAGAPRKAGTLQALALLLPITMAVMGAVVLQPDQGLLRAHFANVPGNEYWVPFLLTVPAICATAFTLVSGYLADLFGRRPVLLVAMVVYILVGVGPYFLHDLIPIAFCRVGVGLCEGVVLTVTTALLGDYFKGRMRDRMMGFQAAIASGAATLLIPLSGHLASTIGWNGPFLIYFISVIWLAGIILFTWEPKPDQTAGETVGKASWAGFPWARVLEICAVTLLGSYFFYTVQFQMPNLLPKFGITDPATIGNMAGEASFGMFVGAIAFQMVVKRSLGVLLLGELTIIAISFLVMGNAPSANVLLGAAFLNQIGCGMLLPTLLTASMKFLPFEHRGRGTGLWQGTFASGQFIVGMSFPLLTQTTGGDISRAFLVVGAVAVIAALIALVMAIRTNGKIAPSEA